MACDVDSPTSSAADCARVRETARRIRCGAYSYCYGVETSRHDHMRELRVQHAGRPYRVLYAFDPRRTAMLLIGGDKTGNDRWYETYVPVADRLYADHLKQLKKEKRTKNG